MIEPESYERLKVSRDGRITTVAINRPDALNAVDALTHEELARVFYELDNDAETDIVVLTGEGEHFCAGGDIKWMQESADDPSAGPAAAEAKRIIFGLLDIEKPVIAKVRGSAIGLGATLALFCDVVFATEDAKIADPHVRVGIVAGDGGAVIWPQLIGFARAKEYLMTGDILTGAEAARIGLVNHAVPAADLDARVDAFAKKLAGGAQRAIRYTKVAVNLGLKQVANAVFETSLAYEMNTFHTADHREAVAAFLEKRKPAFIGK